MNRRGEFALSKVVGLLLILLAVITLVLFVYFLRDKIQEVVEIIMNVIGI
jgi:hypothetical protein